MSATRITVEATVAAPIAQVWHDYLTPADIMQWNAASDDWHTTKANVDLRVGGTFSSRMEAKDGSFGFDFAGTYTKVEEPNRLEYAFGDRNAEITFVSGPKGVTVTVTFDAENTFPVEQQRSGWASHPRPLRSPCRTQAGSWRMTGNGQTSTNTIRLHRVLRAPGERIYRAFTSPDAFAKWLPPHGFFGRVHHMDTKVGGTYRMSFTNLTTGHCHSFGGRYLELVPGERLRYTAVFEDPNMPGEMLTTVDLTKVPVGTDIRIEEAGLPAIIPLDACHLGWQESLTLLAQLVEPDIRE